MSPDIPGGPYVVTVYFEGLGEIAASRIACREAYVSIKEARVRVTAIAIVPALTAENYDDLRRQFDEIRGQGGKVGPIDGHGTIITVEPTTYEALADAIGWGDAYRAGTFSDAHALAYFNYDASHPACACGRRSLDRNHLACGDCIRRACEETPVLDTHAIRFVTGYASAKHDAQGGGERV